MSRIEEHSDVQRDLSDSAHALGATPVRKNNRMMGEGESQLLPDDISLASLLRSCWTVASNFLQTLVIRSLTSERVRYWKAKISFQQPTKGLTFIGASEGTWLGIAPGVMAKLLSYDSVSRRTTALVRIAAGTRYAPHRHAAAEESYVLEGGCNIAGHEMTVGDYHRAEAGTEHHDTSSDDGCLLLVISSPQNEMLR
jgi:quercetin dioxygenase-like cupin family protein